MNLSYYLSTDKNYFSKNSLLDKPRCSSKMSAAVVPFIIRKRSAVLEANSQEAREMFMKVYRSIFIGCFAGLSLILSAAVFSDSTAVSLSRYVHDLWQTDQGL